jgi:site-specific DNA recombinase
LIKAFGVKESAKTDDRKEFQDMLKFCRKENISHIVFFSYDRFSRAGDTTILDKLRKQGIKVHAATQGADDETPSGRMTQKMYLMFAEMENEQRREKIVEGFEE